jgi:hypothetical protein
MWICKRCSEQLEDAFTACWQCGEQQEAIALGSTPRAPEEGKAVSSSTPAMPRLVLEGSQGKRVIVEGDVVRIEKQGMFSGRRDKTLPIRNITSVEVKQPGLFVGFIQFSIAGGKARDSSFTVSGGAYDAVLDENSVVFKGTSKYEVALQIKEYVDNWAPVRDATVTPAPDASVADEIRKLKTLVDDGLITPAQFEHQKRRLLGM